MFTNKLNKATKPYQIKEEVVIKSGLYENKLKHDNVIHESVVVVGSNGLPITNFTIEKNKDKEWETNIRIQSNVDKATIHYETYGDTVDADDINDLNDAIKSNNSNVDGVKKDIESLKQTNAENTENVQGLITQHKADINEINSSIDKIDRNKASKSDLTADKVEYSAGWSVYDELGRKATTYQLNEGLRAKAETNHKHSTVDVNGLDNQIKDIWTAMNGKAFTSHTHTPSQIYLNMQGDTLDEIKAKHIDFDGWDTVEDKLKSLQSQIDAGGGSGGGGGGDVLSVNGKTGIVRLTSLDIPHDQKRTVGIELSEHDKRLETSETNLSFAKADIKRNKEDIEGIDGRVKTLEESGGGGSAYVIPRKTNVPLTNEISIKEESKKALTYQVDSIDSNVKQEDNRFTFTSKDGYSDVSLSISDGQGAFKIAFKEVAGYYSYTHYKTNGDRDDSGWIQTNQVVTFDVVKGDRITVSTGNTMIMQVENIPTTTIKKLMFEGKAINDDPDFTNINKDIAEVKSSLKSKADEKHMHKAHEVIDNAQSLPQSTINNDTKLAIEQLKEDIKGLSGDEQSFNDVPQNAVTEDMTPLKFDYGVTLCSQSALGTFPTINAYGVSLTYKGKHSNYAQIFITASGDIWSRRSGIINSWNGEWYNSKKDISDSMLLLGEAVWELDNNKADKKDVEQLKKELEAIGGDTFHDVFPNSIKESTAPNEFSQGITLCWQNSASNFPTIGESGMSITFIGSRINYGQIFITDNGDMWSRRSGVNGNWSGKWYNAKREIDKKADKVDLDEVFQSGVESNKTLVDALNSKGVSASTSDTIKTNVGKVGNIQLATGNASRSDVLSGRTFSNSSNTGLTGTMTNNGSLNRTITMQGGAVNISPGYYSGGQVRADFSNIVSSYILKGVTVGGVAGTYEDGKYIGKITPGMKELEIRPLPTEKPDRATTSGTREYLVMGDLKSGTIRYWEGDGGSFEDDITYDVMTGEVVKNDGGSSYEPGLRSAKYNPQTRILRLYCYGAKTINHKSGYNPMALNLTFK